MAEPRVNRTLAIPYQLYQDLDSFAREKGMSHQVIILTALIEYLERQKPKPQAEPEPKPQPTEPEKKQKTKAEKKRKVKPETQAATEPEPEPEKKPQHLPKTRKKKHDQPAQGGSDN